MLVRDISKTKAQFFAAAAVIFFGLSMFTSSYMSYYDLKWSVENYYNKYRFLDYYADARNITTETIKKIKAIDGVREACGRISSDITAFAPPKTPKSDPGKVTLRLVSVPDTGRPLVNDLIIQSGSYFDSQYKYLCMLNNKFAEAHGLKKGSVFRAIVNLKECEFKVCGVVRSPEFVLAVKGPFSPLSDDFGIIYVKDSLAQDLFGYESSFNQVHVIFRDGANDRAIIDRIESLLRPNGFVNGTERKKQFSSMIISDEIKHLENTAVVFPSVFLAVAVMIIYIMQKRLINNQRTMIGVMKAFGYSDWQILWHYTKNSLVLALVGSIPAVFAGYYLGSLMMMAYNQVFSIPELTPRFHLRVVFTCILLSSGFCLFAGLTAARRVLRFQPAQSMRQEAPESGRKVIFENVGFIWESFTFSGKMILRNIFRSGQRAFLTIVGVSATIMFFMISLFFMDSIDYAFTQHFFVGQRQDLKVSFSKPVSKAEALALGSMKDVRRVEPVSEMPVEVIKGWMKRETVLEGVSRSDHFTRLIGPDLKRIQIPENGVLISHMVSEKMDLREGDTVTIKACVGNLKVKESSKEIIRKVRVAGVAKQYLGINCFASPEFLSRFIDEGDFVTSALVKCEAGRTDTVKDAMLRINGVAAVESRKGLYDNFLEQLKFMRIFVGIMVTFGSVMGFAIIFNSTIINIMERSRELTSLKVLGYTHSDVNRLLFYENIFLCVFAGMPGVFIGNYMCHFINKLFSNDMFALEVMIYPRTYLIAFLAVFACTALAQWANDGNVRTLDMVEVLKSRE